MTGVGQTQTGLKGEMAMIQTLEELQKAWTPLSRYAGALQVELSALRATSEQQA